jgi:ADP-heptose:LPS heptosyltransferase
MAGMKRIAIFRALQLGDLLLAVPALRAIRARFPQAEITLIGLSWATTFVRRYRHYIDRFVEFAGYPGIKEVPVDLERTRNFIGEQRRYGYDLVVQMHGSGQTSNPFAIALGGRITAGYYEEEPPDGLTLGSPYPHDLHEVFRNLGLAALLGCPDLDPRLEFPLFPEDYAEAEMLLHLVPHPELPLVGIHPGARPPARRWPVEYFAALANYVVHRFGAQIILTGRPEEETTIQQIKHYMTTHALNLTGKTSLGGLAALMSRLDLFVSNDTGPAHLAVAVDCPSITLFGPADYRRWAPLDQERHAVVRRPVACSPCPYWECPIDHRCLRWVRPETVSRVARRFLQNTPQRAGTDRGSKGNLRAR